MPDDTFITNFHIAKIRHLSSFDIPLSKATRQHLIITGRNGSGKTSLLLSIKHFLQRIQDQVYSQFRATKIRYNNSKSIIENYQNTNKPLTEFDKQSLQVNKNTINKIYKPFLERYESGVLISFNDDQNIEDMFMEGNFLIAFFPAHRQAIMEEPQSVDKFFPEKKYQIDDKANNKFLQYMVNLKADRSFARDDNDIETVQNIDSWFDNFSNQLKQILEEPKLEITFNRKNYTFDLSCPNREPFNLNTLSDGFSAVLSIVTELILRMEHSKKRSYDIQGIVLIDEIETHLHIELQKKILPLLISLFPRIQFIVSTHSPFVLNSIHNATVFDLEKREPIEDLMRFSYDVLVENYFESDKYSAIIKDKYNQLKLLSEKPTLTIQEREQFIELKNYLSQKATGLTPELMDLLNQSLLMKIR